MKHGIIGIICGLILAFGVIMLVNACKNKPDCSKIQPYTDAVAATFGTAMQCAHVEVIKTDLIGICAEKGLCNKQSGGLTGPISMIVCPIVVPLAVQMATKPEWGCKGTAAEATLMAACMAIPF